MNTSSLNSSITIGLLNPKSPTNMGAILRAAGCFQANAIFYTGHRHDRAARFSTDTKQASQRIQLQQVDCLLDSIPTGAELVCVELAEGAIPLPEFQHPDHGFYLFGPEDGSISQDIIDQAATVVYIPTIGCLNLAASVNIILYDRTAKAGSIQSGDALIRQSRDTNNQIKVKTKPKAR